MVRPVGRIGWPVVAGLVGTAAYGSVPTLLFALHNSAGSGGYVVTVPDLEPGGLLPAALLMAGLLATTLLASARVPRRWVLPVVAAVTGELLEWTYWLTHSFASYGRAPLNVLVGCMTVPVLAALAGSALLRPANGRPARLAGADAPRSARWALLLPAVVVMTGDLLGLDLWQSASPGTGIGLAVVGYLVGLALLAAVVAGLVRWPRAAADLAALGLVGVGVYDVAQSGFGQSLVVVQKFGSPRGPAPLLPVETAHHASVLGGIQGAVLLALGLWLLPLTVVPDARRLLGREPDPALARRVRELTETRADAVSSAAAELRRIERDLHDGAQGRLVTIGMNLRVAEEMIHSDPHEAAALVVEARVASAAALEELRGLIRGMHPPMLADRGLGEAVRALALDLPLPCDTEIDLPERLAAPLESACYFAVAEVVTNAVRHASAHGLQIRMARTDGRLRIEVVDDGVGGADPARGTGLAGVERRLAAFDGILAVSSPPGGPTIVVMEVPCA
ncbi:sensor histidine kinase [Streptomyces camelliae]|uniref:histidine kinase n=1 Tax=Streptomyces camelliae TaxID=3004093 RepID=A0ABY7P5Z6_9ACTN|nr:histidine kinase [Streptomyces sp. HUAS 2-6]WBO64753.1 histidine kinase [Streptomyces sp. HUAS 2-6]